MYDEACMYLCLYVNICVCVRICTLSYMYDCVYIYVFVDMYVMYVSMYGCIHCRQFSDGKKDVFILWKVKYVLHSSY